MLSLFSLRLAAGMIGALLLLTPGQVNPRLYRVQYLIAFGLIMLAAFFLRAKLFAGNAGAWLGIVLAASLAAVLGGSIVWSLRGAPGARWVGAASAALLAVALGLTEWVTATEGPLGWLLASSATSAAVLGAATTAMLMGHFYLIAPAMSIVPLKRLLIAIFVALLVRMVVSGTGLWFWTSEHPVVSLKDEPVLLWLPLRWGLGFVGPLVLGWMSWQAAKIRSTQSATGMLYVVVVFCFVGELTGQLLGENTGFILQ
jgi:hypothetical protein